VAGDAAAVSRLLPAGGTQLNLSGPRFRTPDTIKSTPLMAAAIYGHREIVRMILERAPNTSVDYADAHGITALHGAAQWCHFGILRLLADRGADLNLRVQGCTPRSLVLEVMPFDALAPPRGPAQQLITVRALLRLGAGTLPRFVPRASNPFEITFAPKYPVPDATILT